MLRIVSITVATTLLDCVAGADAGEPVVCISPGAGAPVVGISPGAGAPVECISPAKAETESTHTSAIANTKRFIVCSPLSSSHASQLARRQNSASPKLLGGRGDWD